MAINNDYKKIYEMAKAEDEERKRERIQREKEEAERLERERIQREKEEAERLERERIQREKEEAERLERERIQREKEEAERLERERIQREKEEAERLERERIQREKEEAARWIELQNAKEKRKKTIFQIVKFGVIATLCVILFKVMVRLYVIFKDLLINHTMQTILAGIPIVMLLIAIVMLLIAKNSYSYRLRKLSVVIISLTVCYGLSLGWTWLCLNIFPNIPFQMKSLQKAYDMLPTALTIILALLALTCFVLGIVFGPGVFGKIIFCILGLFVGYYLPLILLFVVPVNCIFGVIILLIISGVIANSICENM